MDEFDVLINPELSLQEEAKSKALSHFNVTKAAQIGESDGKILGNELGYYHGFCCSIKEEFKMIKGNAATKTTFNKKNLEIKSLYFKISNGNFREKKFRENRKFTTRIQGFFKRK